MNPIGYVRSPFTFKNGTPRQPTVCSQARGMITIEKSIFNNPEHSLEGLDEFTHVWILFVFHKNNNQYTKAKVKPPRLNGRKMGLFSTRSPYRPNNIGLTLAKIETVKGATLTVSGIDILDGTPVLDLKPYIPQYDCPQTFGVTHDIPEALKEMDKSGYDNTDNTREISRQQDSPVDTEISEPSVQDTGAMIKDAADNVHSVSDLPGNMVTPDKTISECFSMFTNACIETDRYTDNQGGDQDKTVLSHKDRAYSAVRNNQRLVERLSENEGASIQDHKHKPITEELPIHAGVVTDSQTKKFNTKENRISDRTATAGWIAKPPILPLSVRFTPTVEEQLQQFTMTATSDNFRLQYLKSSDEAREAIINILHEDPRSTYRRKQCVDSLYYFTLDVIHVTCWFDDTVVEVVRVKPACLIEQCATLTVSGIDILDGTPVLDLKPYIPQYDCPQTFGVTHDIPEALKEMDKSGYDNTDNTREISRQQDSPVDTEISEPSVQDTGAMIKDAADNVHSVSDLPGNMVTPDKTISECFSMFTNACIETDRYTDNQGGDQESDKDKTVLSHEDRAYSAVGNNQRLVERLCENEGASIQDHNHKPITEELPIHAGVVTDSQTDSQTKKFNTKENRISDRTATAEWIAKPPILPLSVRFTPTVEEQLQQFTMTTTSDNFRLQYLKSSEEAREAIINILHEDPRSTYRRKQCVDSLYYFTLDVIHVTCWFDDTVVEVVRVKPACLIEQCKHKFLK